VRLAVWLLIVANLLVAAWGGVEFYVGPPRRGAPTPEIAPERIKLLSAEEARQAHARKLLVSCVEWGGFAFLDAERAERYLESSGLGVKLGQRRLEGDAGWWVLIPPLPSRRVAEARLAQVKQLGIQDAALLADDPRYPNAISLGVYASELGAQRRRDEVTRLGIVDAVAASRDPARVFLRLLEVPRFVIERLAEAKSEFGGAQIAECPRTP
jgi:hypothetical protein